MSIRTARVAEEIQKVLGERLVRGLRDPLPGFVTIRGVEVTSDFAQAKVFVSVFGSDADKQGAIEGLKAQKGALRKEVGTKIRLRQTPDLHFVLDESAERAARVHALLDEARQREQAATTTNSTTANSTTTTTPATPAGKDEER
jgi:ribosome-binding factor A